MTLSLFLWTAGAAIFFAITNSISYNRGNISGYERGMNAGLNATIKRLKDKLYEIEVKHDE